MKTRARFTGKWAVEVTAEPGSIPDRPAPYSRIHAMYRPARIVAEFITTAVHEDPAALRMENGSGFMRTARKDIRLTSLTVYGYQLKKDGSPGQRMVDEKFWNSMTGAPDWAAGTVRDILDAIRGTS